MSEPPPIKLPPTITGASRQECDYALGMYIGEWGDVELAMSELIRKLLDTDMISSQIVIRALGKMQAQREIASELGTHRLKKSDVATLEKLLERVKRATTRRNRIIHGTWTLMLEMGTPPNPKPLTAKSCKWLRIYERPAVQPVLRGIKSKPGCDQPST